MEDDDVVELLEPGLPVLLELAELELLLLEGELDDELLELDDELLELEELDELELELDGLGGRELELDELEELGGVALGGLDEELDVDSQLVNIIVRQSALVGINLAGDHSFFICFSSLVYPSSAQFGYPLP